ncbi:MAG: DNA methyltransferase, partial [Dehalococcoidia bacterium]
MTRLQEPLDGLTAASVTTGDGGDAEREQYRARLRALLPELRQIEGFPVGTDEDILALSDPPRYNACPNPFVTEFVAGLGKLYNEDVDTYQREPFAADVSEGRNDPIFNAHAYHTKVPPKAIMHYILHYTEPGDLIFDGFCGTGMVGVAARRCGDYSTVASLGYDVDALGSIRTKDGTLVSKLGSRSALLSDLSPATTFIASTYNTRSDVSAFQGNTYRILAEVEENWAWIYTTLHKPMANQLDKARDTLRIESMQAGRASGIPWGRINYVIWSDIFMCPVCSGEVVFWDTAVDRVNGRVRDEFSCAHCQAILTKRTVERAWTTSFDRRINRTVRIPVAVPVLVNYNFGRLRFEKTPDQYDMDVLTVLEAIDIPYWYPTDELPAGDKTSDPFSVGVHYSHQFYAKRALLSLAAYRSKGLGTWLPFSALTPRATRMHRIAASRIGGEKKGVGGATVEIITNALYIPSVSVEMNVQEQAKERVAVISRSSVS